MQPLQQDQYWKKRTERKEKRDPTEFAKQCIEFLKDKSRKTVLDLGCGDGRDSIFFAKRGYEVTATDVSPVALEILNKKINEEKITNIQVIEQDLQNLQFPESSFDIIYTHLSLHYFLDEQTEQIFKMLHKMLTRGGFLFIKCKSTEDEEFGKGKEVEKNVFVTEENYVRHFFDEEYMKQKLSNFQIINIEKTKGTYEGSQGEKTSHFIEAIATKT
ncbi:class I SAM-dependent methyltransferase [Candidatus Woesearchaeota archaeon]|nr:class I SAM-dependent methyltransferase [Candidatus Woesearchaeota archaeon]